VGIDWKEFEISVANFVGALDPGAEVKHNVRLPDKHTGAPRQRDVWVKAKICKHFPVNVYISCKHKGRKLNQQDIDAFYGELTSSGAHKGVVYSYSGYTENAICKASNLGISCCSLYQDRPPEIPNILIIPRAYCCTPKIAISYISPIPNGWHLITWDDIFSIKVNVQDVSKKNLLDFVSNIYLEMEKDSVINRKGTFPFDWALEINVPNPNEDSDPLRINLQGKWKVHLGKSEGYLVNGSYSFTEEEFIGTQATLVIDLKGSNPGPNWILLKDIPTEVGSNFAIFILYSGDSKQALLSNFSRKAL